MGRAGWKVFSLLNTRSSTHDLEAFYLNYGLNGVTRWTCGLKEAPPTMRLQP